MYIGHKHGLHHGDLRAALRPEGPRHRDRHGDLPLDARAILCTY